MRGLRRALPILLVAGLLAGGQPGSAPAMADASTLCSALVTGGAINSPTTFDQAVVIVNAGYCNEIDITGTITFTSAPTHIVPDLPVTTLTISGAGTGVLDGTSGSSPAVEGLVVALNHPGQRLVISGITLREFGSAGPSSATAGALQVSGGSVSIVDSTFTGNGTYLDGGAVNSDADVSIADSTFTGNTALRLGGAVHSLSGVTITDSVLSSNEARDAGGAIFVGGSVVSTRSTFEANESVTYGGALSVSGNVTSTDDTFTNNQVTTYDGGAVESGGVFTGNGSEFDRNGAGRSGGAIKAASCVDDGSSFQLNEAGKAEPGDGGALMCVGPSPPSSQVVYFTGTQFTDNTADRFGGALYTNLPVTIEDGLFQGGDAHSGGAIASTAMSTTLVTTDFIDNTASGVWGQGGALLLGAAATTITGGLFEGNVAEADGGAIATGGAVTAEGVTFETNEAGLDASDGGGAIQATGAVEVTECTFVGNVILSKSGGAITTYSTFIARDSVFRDNGYRGADPYLGSGGAVAASGNVTIEGSVFDRNTSPGSGGAIFALGDASITESEFTRNTAVRPGQTGGAGFIAGLLDISDSVVSDNTSLDGGAFQVDVRATVSNSTFRGNAANNVGGALKTSRLVISGSSFLENHAGDGGAAYAGVNATITNSTFYNNTAIGYGGTLYLDGGVTSAVIRFSTLVNTVSPSSRFGSLITSPVSSRSTPIPLTLIGSVLSASSRVCGIDSADPYDPDPPLVTTADSRSSFATDSSCASSVANAVRTTSQASLLFNTPLTSDVTPGKQVLIPGAESVLNDDAPTSLLPSGVTTDQLGAPRNSVDGLTSVGAVQVRPISISAPSSQSVAPGADAAFSVAAVPGVGTAMTFQWQSSRDRSSWSNITGNDSATTSSLVLRSVTAADSGLLIRVRVTDIAGSAFSTGATLTVSSSPGPAPGPIEPSPSPTHTSAPSPLEPVPSGSATPTTAAAGPLRPAVMNVKLVGTRVGGEVVVHGRVRTPGIKSVRPEYRIQGRPGFVRGKPLPVGKSGLFIWRHRSDKAVTVYFSAGGFRSKAVRIGAKSRS